MILGDAESISGDRKLVWSLEKGQQTKATTNRDEKQTNRHISKLTNMKFLILL